MYKTCSLCSITPIPDFLVLNLNLYVQLFSLSYNEIDFGSNEYHRITEL